MRGNNFGEFDYFFGISKTYLDEELVSDIIYNNFLSFHISGYNDGKGTIVGNIHNGNDEYPINVIHKNYDNETSTIITSSPKYYIGPKLEIEKKKDESILRLDKVKTNCLILEEFIASKDKSSISAHAFIYGPEIIDQLIEQHNDECRSASLSFEKLQSYGINPGKIISKEMSGPILESYQEFLDELGQATSEINNENEQKRTK